MNGTSDPVIFVQQGRALNDRPYRKDNPQQDIPQSGWRILRSYPYSR